MSLWSYLKNLFSRRVAKRIAEKPPSGFRQLKPNELEKLGYSPKSRRYVEIGARLAKGQTPSLSRTKYLEKSEGAHPARLTAERKAGTRAYRSATTEAQARAQIATRARRARHKDFKKVQAEHTFIDRDGIWRSELFKGRDLAIMQEYRKDWKHALEIGDDAGLKRYKTTVIHNIDGERVFPATDLDTIRQFYSRLSPRMRARFERQVFYPTKADALAA